MIVVDLECANAHRFEGWFASHETFAAQHKTHMLSCPVCSTHNIERRPSAPSLVRSRADTEQAAVASSAQLLTKLIEALRDQAIASEDLGEHFANEARKIHYGDAHARPIKGSASLDETHALLDEGINVLPLPWVKEDLH